MRHVSVLSFLYLFFISLWVLVCVCMGLSWCACVCEYVPAHRQVVRIVVFSVVYSAVSALCCGIK